MHCLKNKVYILIKNTWLLKLANKYLKVQRAMIFWLVEGHVWFLMAADWLGWWLLKAGMAVVISLNETTIKFAVPIDSFFSEMISP